MSKETDVEKDDKEKAVKKETEESKEAGEAEKRREEENIVEERVYTIPLGRAWIGPRNKRTPRAVRLLRSFILRHMKIDEEESLKISDEVNRHLWRRGIQKPPRKIRVRAVKDTEGIVTVRLAEGE